MYFTDQNLLKSIDPMEIEFRFLEIQELNITTDRVQCVYEKLGSYVQLCLLLEL